MTTLKLVGETLPADSPNAPWATGESKTFDDVLAEHLVTLYGPGVFEIVKPGAKNKKPLEVPIDASASD